MTPEPRGYINVARKFFTDDPLWLERRPRTRAEAWLDLIFLAAWRPTVYSTTHGADRLARGEFVASVRYLAVRWSWSKSAVQRFLAFLAKPEGDEKAGRIAGQREGHNGMIYLLPKYELYQGGGDEGEPESGTPDGTSAGHSRDTGGTKKKQVKQEKQDTSLRSVSADPDVAAVVAHYRARHPRRSVSPKAERLIARVLAGGWTVADCVAAIDGNADDAWHAEKRKHELEYVLRDDKRDGFREQGERGVAPLLTGPELVDGWMSDELERLTRPAGYRPWTPGKAA